MKQSKRKEHLASPLSDPNKKQKHFRIRDFVYYDTLAKANLLAISRTAIDGTIDISAGGSSLPPLCKENYGHYDNNELDKLKQSNDKLTSLNLSGIQRLTQEEIKQKVLSNFDEALKKAWNISKNFTLMSPVEVKKFILYMAKIISQEFVQESELIRKHDSLNYPYSESSKLEGLLTSFSEELFTRLSTIRVQKNRQSSKLHNTAIETAAWVEYRVNLTDHFFADGCGKVSLILSTFVLMSADKEMPLFLAQKEYFFKAPMKQKKLDDPDTVKSGVKLYHNIGQKMYHRPIFFSIMAE